MDKPNKHILVCASFRVGGAAKGICDKKGSADFLAYIENEVIDRGMDGVLVSSTGCLKVCDRGPAIVVYPDNVWYGNVNDEEAIDAILDAMEDDTVADAYQIA